jgi:hypothetical protein
MTSVDLPFKLRSETSVRQIRPPLRPPLVSFLLLRQLNMSGFVIPADAGIQAGAGCQIKSGMTALAYLVAGLITSKKGSSEWG